MKRSMAAAVAASSVAVLLAVPWETSAWADPVERGRTEVDVPSYANPDRDVKQTLVTLHAPLPEGAPPHPAACDDLRYVRYRAARGPDKPADADAVVVFHPGTAAEPSGVDQPGRNLVKAGAAAGKNVEFWALDRRYNCVNDNTGIDRANEIRDPGPIFDYYFGGKPIDGRKFSGFSAIAGEPLLKWYGLSQEVNDQQTVMTREIPDLATRRRKMFVSGHSLGGFASGAYAGWDFGGTAGYQQIAGIVAVDGVPSLDPLFLEAIPGLKELSSTFLGLGRDAVGGLIASGAFPAAADFTKLGLPISVPQLTTLLAALAVAARYAPGGQDIARLVPKDDPAVGLLLRLSSARSYTEFLTGLPGWKSFKLTNQAFLGRLLDDNSQPIGGLTYSMGTFGGGPVTEKTFPAPAAINKIPVLGDILINLALGPQKRIAPTDATKLYGWRDYDQVRDIGQTGLDGKPVTWPAAEVSSINDVSRVNALGSQGAWEPYIPIKYIADIVFATAGVRNGDLAALKHIKQAKAGLPTLTLRGTKSFISGISWLTPVFTNAVSCENYTHQDMVSSAYTQNNGRPECVSSSIVKFVIDTTDSNA